MVRTYRNSDQKLIIDVDRLAEWERNVDSTKQKEQLGIPPKMQVNIDKATQRIIGVDKATKTAENSKLNFGR